MARKKKAPIRRRLYTAEGVRTKECNNLLDKLSDGIRAAYNMYPDVDIRDLQLATFDAAMDVGLCMVLDRRRK